MLSRSNQRHLAGSAFTITIATVHRFVTAGFKGYLGILATLGAYRREHLAAESGTTRIAKAAVVLCPFRLTAGWKALGLVAALFRGEECLPFGAEGEIGTKMETFQQFVHRAHCYWMTSFSCHSWLEFGHPTSAIIANGDYREDWQPSL